MYERPTVSLPKSEKKPYVFLFHATYWLLDFFKLQSDLWNELYIYLIFLTYKQFIAREYYFHDHALFSGIIALLWSTINWLIMSSTMIVNVE